MQWDMEELKLVAGSQRVQKGRRNYFACPGNEDDTNNLCFDAIRWSKSQYTYMYIYIGFDAGGVQ